MDRKINITETIFFLYCIFLIWLILFKMAFSFGDIQLFEGNRAINVVPFRYLTDVGSIHTKEVLMNIIVFICQKHVKYIALRRNGYGEKLQRCGFA